MFKSYEHKFDSSRTVEAIKVTSENRHDVDELVGDAFTVREGQYVVMNSEGDLFLRADTVFEAKYKLSDNQDQPLSFDEGENTTPSLQPEDDETLDEV